MWWKKTIFLINFVWVGGCDKSKNIFWHAFHLDFSYALALQRARLSEQYGSWNWGHNVRQKEELLLLLAAHGTPLFTVQTRCALKSGNGYSLYYKMGTPMKQAHSHLMNCHYTAPCNLLLTPPFVVLGNTKLPSFTPCQHSIAFEYESPHG